MCGRFTLRTPAAELVRIFELLRTDDIQPRYNIAPTQPVAIIRAAPDGRELSLVHWGLIPSWSKDPSIGSRMINARAESIATKPSFRSAFRRRRCLIPADGFYEWQKVSAKSKQPFLIGRSDWRPFAFAGLWEHWTGPDGGEIQSCTIITTEANELLQPLHDRMPVILEPEEYSEWLDPAVDDAERLQPLLDPYPPDLMALHPVSTTVNNPRNEQPACIEPLNEPDAT